MKTGKEKLNSIQVVRAESICSTNIYEHLDGLAKNTEEAISQVAVGYFQTIQKLQVPLFTYPSKTRSQVTEIFI